MLINISQIFFIYSPLILEIKRHSLLSFLLCSIYLSRRAARFIPYHFLMDIKIKMEISISYARGQCSNPVNLLNFSATNNLSIFLRSINWFRVFKHPFWIRLSQQSIKSMLKMRFVHQQYSLVTAKKLSLYYNLLICAYIFHKNHNFKR